MRRLTSTVVRALHANRSRDALICRAAISQLDETWLVFVERRREPVQRTACSGPIAAGSPLKGNAAMTLLTADSVGHVMLLASVDVQIVPEHGEHRVALKDVRREGEYLVVVNFAPVVTKSDQPVCGWVGCGAAC